MKIMLTVVLCSLLENTCLETYTLPIGYDSTYDCLLAGYKKAIEKTEELGRSEVNQYGIYVKFVCSEGKNLGKPTDYKIYINGNHLLRITSS